MCVFGSVGIAASGVALAGGVTGLEVITAGLGLPAFTAVVEFPDPGGLAGGSLDSVLPALPISVSSAVPWPQKDDENGGG